MDRKLRKILTECIRDIETGARDVEGCLQRHPDRAADLRPHLEMWSGLNAASTAQPNFGSQQRGQHKLLATLADMEKRGEKRRIPALVPAVAKAVAVALAAVLLVGGAAGASAALGGPNVADEVLTTVGITSDHGGGPGEGTLDTARDATEDVDEAQPGLDTAERGAENSDGPPPAAEDGLNTAGEHAQDGLDTADEASDGAGDASADSIPDDVPPDQDSAPDDVPPDGEPPEDVPPDSVPDSAPAPDSVPVGPQP